MRISKESRVLTPPRAYEAIKTTATDPDYDGLPDYDRLGWVPCDWESESVSKTQEYGYDDWCIARWPMHLAKRPTMNISCGGPASYRKHLRSLGQVHARQGPQRPLADAFDPNAHVDITEGTSWQYSWYVPQDVPGLIALHGGNENFTKKLDPALRRRQTARISATKELMA